MKIKSISIRNFRGIREATLRDLGSMVVIAGQNGSGKSCVFDAIRLLKSVYGGYQHNEWQQWMGEFQIRLTGNAASLAPLFNDKNKPVSIDCEFEISNEEKAYISANMDELLREIVWQVLQPETYQWGTRKSASFALQFKGREKEIEAKTEELRSQLTAELASDCYRGTFYVDPGADPRVDQSIALSVIFSTFRPRELGVIDYHGAQRHYGREYVQGINLSLDTPGQQGGQSALYNYGNKYNSVKSEMAAAYVKDLLAEKAGSEKSRSTLTETLKELFSTFFPEKVFLGPQPSEDGSLTFPVMIGTSAHDLDDLSAGEKEILYGYLRIRDSAPRHSIVLLDEPELHLNPRLIRGLPEFYRRNLGDVLRNQIWLVTHSDALLREVVGRQSFTVYHMQPCSKAADGEDQAKQLVATGELETALVDLVGDLASYRPGGKLVICEGGGDSEFDKGVISKLFPQLASETNVISGTNKERVRTLHQVLSNAATKGQLPFKFYAITDRDSDPLSSASGSLTIQCWDSYHVENYLLVPKYISAVMARLGSKAFMSEQAVDRALLNSASETLGGLVCREVGRFINDQIVNGISIRVDPNGNLQELFSDAVNRTMERVNRTHQEALNPVKVERLIGDVRLRFEADLHSGEWKKTFAGRDVLKRFVSAAKIPVSYEVFRNLILSEMSSDGYEPAGMKFVVDRILDDPT